ncbi:MAG: triose-phosphate isomerase [Chthonomonadales bacterium]|nr:triose-phosphate isomerase [Chthonomonadales bacterium]
MRRKIIAGNWKMHMLTAEGRALARELAPLGKEAPGTDVIVCPPYTALSAVGEVLAGSGVHLGAQDVFWKEKGAYTGQVAPAMLVDIGVSHVIVGHSESRGRFGVPEPGMDDAVLAHFGDSDKTVNLKLRAARAAGLIVLCCVGETLAEREAGQTDAVVSRQVAGALEGLDAGELAGVVMAYEPVWAIGTGKTCEADEADRVCGVIRSEVGRLFGGSAADAIRIQYGGSVKPGNAGDLLGRPNIDGALVGGASLVAADFAAIVKACPA